MAARRLKENNGAEMAWRLRRRHQRKAVSNFWRSEMAKISKIERKAKMKWRSS
jgi:hypothetical protein